MRCIACADRAPACSAAPRSSASWCAPTRARGGTTTPGTAASRSLIARRQLPAPRDDRRQPFQLLAADRRLDVGQPVVEADDSDRLDDDLRRVMTHGVGHAHAVMPQQPELARLARRSPSSACRRRRSTAACAGGTRSRRRRRAAGRCAATRRSSGSRCRRRRRHPRSPAAPWRRPTATMAARSHGMPSWWTQSIAFVRGVMAPSTQRGIDVERGELDVDEDRRRAAVADGVGGRDERVADRDDLVARPDAAGGAAPGAAPSCSSRRRRRAARRRLRRTPARTPPPPDPA